MLPRILTLFVLAVGLLAGAARAQSVDVLPPSGQWVTDRADLLTPSEEQALTDRLRGYADTTSTQIVVVTLPDLGGQDIGAYATELGQRWGVGQEGKDNGAVILVARDERKVFIATGYGLEGAIPDAVAARIVRSILTPSFRAGEFYGGLSRAADALMLAARGEFTAEAVDPARPGGADIAPARLFVLLMILCFRVSGIRGGRGGGGGGRHYRRHGGPPVIIWGGGGSGGGGFSGGGFGGFSGGGGGFGGGGAGGGW
ncbi:MAG: TPM domain-containing protein [Rhodothermales bacterium]|nr:TPM domain-containing protein [Rhodothermales bacterium]